MMTIPATMLAVQASDFSIDALELTEVPVPALAADEILVRIKAASLNYRDLVILQGSYLPSLERPFIPLSDACGVVVGVGGQVSRFKIGDRVCPVYTQGWYNGLPTPEQRTLGALGGPGPGVLQQYLAVRADDAVLAPSSLDDMQAATLPIAALTAWSVLKQGNVRKGSQVLIQGGGGVSLFALQFAKLAQARVIALSSSDEKLEIMKTMGADVTINYRDTPDWVAPVRAATFAKGVDIVVEVGGGQTLEKSLMSCAYGAFVGVVGFVSGATASIPLRSLIGPMVSMTGIAVGSRTDFETMNRNIDRHGLQPVIDSRYELADIKQAFKRLESGRHFGKVIVSV